MQGSTLLTRPGPQCTALYCTALYCTMYIILYTNVLPCIVLYCKHSLAHSCTALHSTILYCTALCISYHRLLTVLHCIELPCKHSLAHSCTALYITVLLCTGPHVVNLQALLRVTHGEGVHTGSGDGGKKVSECGGREAGVVAGGRGGEEERKGED